MRLLPAIFVPLLAAAALLWAPSGAHAVRAGQPCGATAAMACDKGLWCEPAPGRCATTAGVCVAVPRLCVARRNSKNFHPVCGCNNKTYSSDCFRRAYRVPKLRDGKC
jgi:hypothetical protein